jgi:two-component system response regulator HydG
VRRIGSDTPQRVDLRVVAATHVDLDVAVKDGRFRQDLFYRLNVVTVRMPALRERPEDIALLAQHFVDRAKKKLGGRVQRVSREAESRMVAYAWPGNVREMQNAIERAMILARGEEIEVADLPPGVGSAISPVDVENIEAASVSHLPYMQAKKLAIAAFEKRYLTGLLQAHRGNVSAASRAAGMDRTNFRRLAKEYGVDVASARGE